MIDLSYGMDRDVDVVCWDMDSTMFDTSGRHWMIPEIRAGRKTWNDYAMACESDVPFPGSVTLCCMLAPYSRQVAISGRSACAMDLTWKSVRDHNIPLDDIKLRPDGNYENNALFKLARMRDLERDGYVVRLLIEDDKNVAEVIRSAGYSVLVVNPCYPERTSEAG